jgi:predicted acylesterase/phospholipase RssA
MTYDTICLSGGGIKGFSFVGALEELVKHKHIDIMNINNWVGTSAGALICYLFSLRI